MNGNATTAPTSNSATKATASTENLKPPDSSLKVKSQRGRTLWLLFCKIYDFLG